jgi:hypothetical protein
LTKETLKKRAELKVCYTKYDSLAKKDRVFVFTNIDMPRDQRCPSLVLGRLQNIFFILKDVFC